jgi:hypothetical protein
MFGWIKPLEEVEIGSFDYICFGAAIVEHLLCLPLGEANVYGLDTTNLVATAS